MNKYSLLDLDDDDIFFGNWKAVCDNLKNAFPQLGFKKSSHDNIVSIWANNVPDDCALQFNECAFSIKRYHLRLFVKKNDEFLKGFNSQICTYDRLFEVVEKWLRSDEDVK